MTLTLRTDIEYELARQAPGIGIHWRGSRKGVVYTAFGSEADIKALIEMIKSAS